MAKKKKYKRIINDLQNITQKTKDRATRISLKTGVNSSSIKSYLKFLKFHQVLIKCHQN